MESEQDYLLLSGIQHFAFCRRQWALIHIEGLWHENVLTFEGREMHERAHNPFLTEKRGDLLVSRDLPVFSNKLGITGQCDVVEFRVNSNGVSLFGREGKWLPCPVEYKRGEPKEGDYDRLQLCAQAMCIEEMLLCPTIENAYLYYGQQRRRTEVALDAALRRQVEDMCSEMWIYYRRQTTPKVKTGKHCKNCSLADVCMSSLNKQTKRVSDYMREIIQSPRQVEDK
ncbi:CRISPR-associated protein Cas4 [Clostridia bacterium]|nr:CRISPR-associated protein Cas4 [Clostridia bacterium]